MSDNLRVCEDCGDAYTLGRFCTTCLHQRMIDSAEAAFDDLYDIPEDGDGHSIIGPYEDDDYLDDNESELGDPYHDGYQDPV